MAARAVVVVSIHEGPALNNMDRANNDHGISMSNTIKSAEFLLNTKRPTLLHSLTHNCQIEININDARTKGPVNSSQDTKTCTFDRSCVSACA